MTSTWSSRPNRILTALLSVVGITWMAFWGMPVSSRASLRMSPKITFEWMASEPPLSITALPDLRQRLAASTVTLGRDSYMKPITPRGIRTRPTTNPLGLFHIPVTSPTGSGRATTSFRPSAIDRIVFSSRVNRSIMAALKPFSFAKERSFSFSSLICSSRSSNLWAMSSRAASFLLLSTFLNCLEESRASFVISSIMPSMDMRHLPLPDHR